MARDVATARDETARAEADAARANEHAGNLELEAATQRQRAAQAELELAELKKKQGPRWIDQNAFAAALRGKATGTVTISAAPDLTGEAGALATQYWAGLYNAGWNVGYSVLPMDPYGPDRDLFTVQRYSDVPATLRIGHRQPEKIVLVANSITDPTPTYLALKDALQAAGLGVGLVADTRLAPGTFRLVIAPKQP